VAEELRSTLSKVEGLQVASRRASNAVQGKGLDLRALGRELGVTHLLEGTVRSAGDRLRVTVTLTGTSDGFQLWSERYDRKMDDVFEIQDDIARRVTAALRIHLTSQRSARRGTTNLEAYRAYLRGRHHWNRRTERSLRQSVTHMHEAIAMDPSYAEARAGLADALVTLGIYGAAAPIEVMTEAFEAARAALENNPSLAEALVVRGAVQALRTGAGKQRRRIFGTRSGWIPRYPTGHHWYASHLLMPLGRFEDAGPLAGLGARARSRRGRGVDLAGPAARVARRQRSGHRTIPAAARPGPGVRGRPLLPRTGLRSAGAFWRRGGRAGAGADLRRRKSRSDRDAGVQPGALGAEGTVAGGSGRLRALGSKRFVSPALLALVHIGLEEHSEAIACSRRRSK
jgi:serine/threonine-protein kinase